MEDIQRLEKTFRLHPVRPGAAADGAGHPAHTVLCLAEMSDRLGLALFFDPATRTIKNGEGKVIPPLTYDSVIPTLPG